MGRVALVTGGGSGIGRAIALKLAQGGSDIAVLDLNAAAATTVADEVRSAGRSALAVPVDVADATSVAAAVARATAEVGRIEVCVNSAGIADFTAFTDLDEARFDRMVAVHLKGTYLVCRAVVPGMLAARSGRIVNISSAAGLNGGGPGLAHYAAAKAGVIGLTKSLALELGPHGITVNAIAPGLIDTPLIRQAGAPADLYDAIVARIPVRRIGRPDDIAAACAYLASEEAAFCTGQVLSPNGGAVV